MNRASQPLHHTTLNSLYCNLHPVQIRVPILSSSCSITYGSHDDPTGSMIEKTEATWARQPRRQCSPCGSLFRVTVDALLWLLVNLQFLSQLQGQSTKEVYLSRKTKGVAPGRSAGQWASRAHSAIGRPHALLAKAPPYVVLEHVCLAEKTSLPLLSDFSPQPQPLGM